MNTQIDPKEGSIRVKTYPQSLQGHMHNARQSLDIDIRASSLTGCSCMDLLFVSSHYRLWLDNPPLPSHVPPPPRACERAAVTTEAANLTPSRTSLSTTCCHSPANSSQPPLPTQPPPSPPLLLLPHTADWLLLSFRAPPLQEWTRGRMRLCAGS